MIYEYFINMDERGEFSADVRTPSGRTVFEIHGFDIFEDGFMDHGEDIEGLRYHLIDLHIISATDDLTFGN